MREMPATMADPMKRVRASCATVANEAKYVQIDWERLEQYASSIPLASPGSEGLDPRYHFLDGGPKTVAYVLCLEAINFGSGFFPWIQKAPGLSGYFTFAYHLRRYFDLGPIIDPSLLVSLRADDCAKIFHQSMRNETQAELMRLYARSLNELGSLVKSQFHGSFTDLVESSGHEASQLVSILETIPSFRDSAQYRGEEVWFLKRAQIAVSDLNLAFGGERWGDFRDVEGLTVFADNVLPHVLRVDGVLRYAPELSKLVDNEVFLEAGSPEEVEIRACAITACERLVSRVQAREDSYTARDLDATLWNQGHLPRYQSLPRHRCRTIYY
jgi:hypothetical protein